ncbi:MAG: polyketide synthase dehydratase domain-containing protein [Thermodesulfobacteriota bacterium]
MAQFPHLSEQRHSLLDIRVQTCWFDHCFQGRAVLPAVEALQILAGSVLAWTPQARVWDMQDVSFEKFLVLQPGIESIQALIKMHPLEQGGIVCTLLSKQWLPALSCSRLQEHARVTFDPQMQASIPDIKKFSQTSLDDFSVPAETVYTELVPFCQAYHNIISPVAMDGQAARTQVFAAEHETQTEHLGSPFPLDAALHAACVWGQRYVGVVGFPVGFGRRTVFLQTHKGQNYSARMVSTKKGSRDFTVDILLEDAQGRPVEVLTDVVMRDVSGGRLTPPAWICAA